MSGTGAGAVRHRLFFCPVCGHVEWVALGSGLPAHYRCPLCGAGVRTMLPLDDPRLARHTVVAEELAPRVFRIRKRPPFPAEYEHVSYALDHPDGLILFDSPGIFNPAALAVVRALGRARLLVTSHSDFVAAAGLWGEALGVPVWMGAEDEPLAGNLTRPDVRVAENRTLAPDLEVVRLAGHSEGSLGVYWAGAPAGPVLLAGDAVAVWPHPGPRTQLSLFQDPPLRPATRDVLARRVSLLGACTGTLRDADGALAALLRHPSPFARPYRGDPGGVWLDGVAAR